MSATMKIEEPDLGYKQRGLYYGGRWVEATSGRSFASINPSTGTKLGDVPYADAKDVDLAVKAAARGFEEWRKVSQGRPCDYSGMTYELILRMGAVR